MLKFLRRRFDPRLAAELKTQRRPIILGLLCVLVTSILTGGSMVLLSKYSLEAIADAGGVVEQRILPNDDLKRLAELLDKSEGEVDRALSEVQTKRPSDASLVTQQEQLQIASRLDVPVESVRNALGQLGGTQPAVGSARRAAVDRLGLICLLVVAVFTVKYWFTRGQTYFLSYAATRLATNMRQRLFNKLQRLPISYFNEKRVGSTFSVLTNDVNVYQNAVSIVRDSIDAPVKAITAFCAIVWIEWRLAAVVCLFLPLMAAAIQRNARKMKVAQGKVQEDLASLSAMTQETLQGTRVVKSFAAEENMIERYKTLVEKAFRTQMAAVRRLASLRPLVELIGAVGVATVLYICGWLAYTGGLQIADIAAVIVALDAISQGARSLGHMNNTYAQVQAASERIYREILDVPEQQGEETGARTLPVASGKIEFRNVSFAYPDGTAALRNVSFTLEPGTSLALVGPSGAGKSTIADLILRFYDPTEGEILFDGVDIRELRVSWLRSQIGVVPQQTFLFAGTLGENIRLGSPEAPLEQVREAAVAAHADVFISAMPEAYETEIGERGVRVSGGEAQRIAIARALVRKPALLLLDEATSALDAHSEKAVQEALDEIMKERTTLFIAHRLTTAARADKILVLRRGEIVEQGSHRELMAQDGAYAGMYRAFSSGVLVEAID